jgi:ParB family transcriptional regulator, chromosome partitioning protein
MGDIDSLAASIRDVGLLHPIVIAPAGRLIAGARRLKAVERLGRADIDVTVADLEQIVRGGFPSD